MKKIKRKNQKKSNFRQIHSFALFFLMGLAFFGGQALSLNAQQNPASPNYNTLQNANQNSVSGQNTNSGSASSASKKTADQNKVCQVEMGKFLQPVMKDYYGWIDGHFENKSATGSLLEDAFRRYAELRASIMEQYTQYEPTPGTLQQAEGLESGACLDLVNKALSDARKILERKAVSTSSVKKSTALVEKYKEINGKLRGLNEDFVKMKAYLTTFADKLPCYVKKSCNKG